MNDFWDNFNKLPQELIDIIWKMVSFKVKLFVIKDIYINNHYLIYDLLSINHNTYYRNIIKNDCFFVFERILLDDMSFHKNKKFLNNMNYLINQYGAYECKIIFIEFCKKNKISKNMFKKKTTTSRWTN